MGQQAVKTKQRLVKVKNIFRNLLLTDDEAKELEEASKQKPHQADSDEEDSGVHFYKHANYTSQIKEKLIRNKQKFKEKVSQLGAIVHINTSQVEEVPTPTSDPRKSEMFMEDFQNSVHKVRERMTTYTRADSQGIPMENDSKKCYDITSIDEFIHTLKELSVTKTVLVSSEPNQTGFKLLFEDFFKEIRRNLEIILVNASSKEINEALVRLSSYIMRKLHSSIWNKERTQNDDDTKFIAKISSLQGMSADQLELPEAEQTVNWPMWELCVHELNQMARLKTPFSK